VGLLVTAPLTQIALALVYRNLFGLSGAAPAAVPSPFPPPPISDPRG